MLTRILTGLGVLIAAALFAALLIPYFVDWTDFRSDFERQASRIVGKEVVVHGSVDARLLPFPSVTMHDVTIGREPDGTPSVSIEQFSMDAELAPFLSGEALIYDMRITRPKARLRLLPDGTLDWMRGNRADVPARTVILENVHLTDGEIEFIDEQSQRTRKLSNLNAEMSAKTLAGPWRIEGKGALDGESGRFTISTSPPDERQQSLSLRTRITPDKYPFVLDMDGELNLAANKPRYAGTFTAIMTQPANKKDAPPRSSGQFELTNERLRVPDYRLEIGPVDDVYVINGEATLDTGNVPEFLLIANGQQIDVNRFSSKGAYGKTARDPAVSARQRLASLLDVISSVPVPQVAGRASIRLPAIIAGDTSLRDIRLDLQPSGNGWTIENAVGTLPGRTRIEAKGRLNLADEIAFDGNLVVASNQPSGFASWLVGSVDPTLRSLDRAGFSADVSLRSDRQHFDNLEIALGTSTIKGKIERVAAAERAPSLAVDLEGDVINLDAARAFTELFTGPDSTKLSGYQVVSHLKAETLSAFGLEGHGVETDFTMADGALTLNRLSIRDLAGAELTTNGDVKLSDQLQGSGEFTFKATDLASFAALLRDRLPAHPSLDHLVRNAGWYGNTALRGTLALGGQDNGLVVTMAGVSNGSRLNLDYRMSDLVLSDTTTMRLETTLENGTTSILVGQSGLNPLPIDADANSRLTLRVEGQGREPANTSLTFSTDRTSFTANGKVDIRPETFLNGTLALALESADLEPYLMMNGLSMPQIGAGLPAKMQGNMVIESEQIRLPDLNAIVAENQLTGDLTFVRKADQPVVRGAVTLAKADLFWIAEAVFGSLTNPETAALSDAPLSAPIVANADIELKLNAEQFWPGFFGPVSGFETDFVYKGPDIQLNAMSGNWNNGVLKGRLSMSNVDNTAVARANLILTDADLAGMAWQRDETPIINGKLSMTMDAQASGKTIKSMVANLGGAGELRFGDVQIRGLNLGILQPLLTATDPIKDIDVDKTKPIVEPLLTNGTTDLKPLAAPFAIASGVVRFQDLTITNDLARLNANAEFDLPEQQLKAAANIEFAAGQERLADAEPAIRLDFSGPFASPQRSLDVTELTNFLSLRAFERERRRVERLQSNSLEKQRLRREASFYQSLVDQRQKEAQQARQQEAEEKRLRSLSRDNDSNLKAAQEPDTKAQLSPADLILPKVGVP